MDKTPSLFQILKRFRSAIALFIIGLSLLSIAFSFLLIYFYRAIHLEGSWQEFAAQLTLQPLPHIWRAAIIGLVGLVVICLTLVLSVRKLLGPFVSGGWGQLFRQMDSFDLRSTGPKIVVIGGGIGTAQLVRGLKKNASRLSVVVHMTDEGGSTGRLRRALGTPAFGDIVSNIVALSDSEELLKDLLLYRFEGDRYGGDTELGGHKLGNLLFAAMADITGDLNHAISKVSRIFNVHGKVLPVTLDQVYLRARTRDKVLVEGEENIDLGRYEGAKVLDTIWYEPEHAKTNPQVIEAIREADIIILGPGDLYTTILANLIFPELKEAIEKSDALKCYILNIANKPFETRGYELSDFLDAFKRHGAEHTFNHILVNTNQSIPIPSTPEYEGYSFVQYDREKVRDMGYQLIEGDFLQSYMGGVEGKGVSLYHDPQKIAQAVMDTYQAYRSSYDSSSLAGTEQLS